MTTINMDANCLNFFVGLQGVKPNSKIAIYEEAVKRAYKDMASHVLHYTSKEFNNNDANSDKLKTQLKERIVDYLVGQEPVLLKIKTQNDFDKWHEKTCNKITKYFTEEGNYTIKNNTFKITPTCKYDVITDKGFGIGHAQKLLNMTLKYVYLFYQYFDAVNPGLISDSNKFKSKICYFHAPVDSKVITAVCKGYKDENGNKIILGINSLKDENWSKIIVYKEYLDFQNDLRKKPVSKNPFLWELVNWPFGR